MARRYSRILKFASEHPWAILPARLDSIIELLELRATGRMFTDEEIRARIDGAAARPAAAIQGGPVAIIPLTGVLAPRLDLMTEISGGTSVSAFIRAVRAAVDNPDIAAIALDVSSPGGSVFGIEEGAAALHALRGRKPIVAVANHLMASAAYWLASQADEIVASPSSQIGSIGVIGVHQDVSGAQEKLGIKTTLISAGKYKTDGTEHAPLSDSARASMQQLVDSYYAAFTRDVARGRAVPIGAVREGFGQGQIFGARQALDERLVDAIATLDEAIGHLARGKSRISPRAERRPAIGAPMPMPHQHENEGDFIDRCMGDSMMNDDYQDPAQRRAVCQKQWDQGMMGAVGQAAAAEIAEFRARLAAHEEVTR